MDRAVLILHSPPTVVKTVKVKVNGVVWNQNAINKETVSHCLVKKTATKNQKRYTHGYAPRYRRRSVIHVSHIYDSHACIKLLVHLDGVQNLLSFTGWPPPEYVHIH